MKKKEEEAKKQTKCEWNGNLNWKCVCVLCSGFSTEVVFYTMGTLPALPLAPRLVRAGVSWVTLEWGRPEGSPSEEQLKYTLEIQEDNSVSNTKTYYWHRFCSITLQTAPSE